MTDFLVTGGAGFIGSNIVDFLLREGANVRVLDNLMTGRRENIAPYLNRVSFIEGDIRDPATCEEAVRGAAYVLHQAAVPSVPRSVADPILNHEANITGTLNLLIAARDAGVKRVVFASSSSIYGDQPSSVQSEALVPMPISPYAAAKAACEHYLRAFSACYGMETAALRYFNVFGPRQDPKSQYSAVIPLFICAMLRGERPVIHGDGMQSRDFTYVEDNARANFLAATADFEARGQGYNIATGCAFSIMDLVNAINKALGATIAPIHIEARVGDIRVSQADIELARRDMGYTPRFTFEEGLACATDWYRGNLSPA